MQEMKFNDPSKKVKKKGDLLRVNESRRGPIPLYGSFFTFSKFLKLCLDGSITPKDGIGRWATSTEMLLDSDVFIDRIKSKHFVPEYTHVVWFRK
jgi:hypothetical protein